MENHAPTNKYVKVELHFTRGGGQTHYSCTVQSLTSETSKQTHNDTRRHVSQLLSLWINTQMDFNVEGNANPY